MIRNIVTNEKRELYFVDEKGFIQLCDVVGVQGEKNAEVFHIFVPTEISGATYDEKNFPTYKWYAVTENEHNGYQEYQLELYSSYGEPPVYMFALSDVHTVDPTLRFGLSLRTKDGRRIWDSEIVEFRFLPNVNINADSVIKKAIIKINYDKLYDMLINAGIIITEREPEPTQEDINQLIEIAREAIDKEAFPVELQDALYQAFGDPRFLDHQTGEEITEKVEAYPRIFGDWVHQVALDTYPIIGYGVDGNLNYREVKNDIDYIIQTLADTIWHMITELPIPSTHIDWQTVKDVIDNYPREIRKICARELGDILNSVTQTTEYSNLEWSEIKAKVESDLFTHISKLCSDELAVVLNNISQTSSYSNLSWKDIKDKINSDLKTQISDGCSAEMGEIFNDITDTENYSNQTWEQLKVSAYGLYDVIEAMVEEEIDNGTY